MRQGASAGVLRSAPRARGMAALTAVQQCGRAVFKLRLGRKEGTCFMIDARRGLLWTAAHCLSDCKPRSSRTWREVCEAGLHPCARAFVGTMCDIGMADAPGGAVKYRFRAEVLRSTGGNMHEPAGPPDWHNLDGALLVIRRRLVHGVEADLELDATGAPVFRDVDGAPLPALPLAGAPPRFGEEPIVLLGYPGLEVTTVLSPTHGFVEAKQTRDANDGEYLLTTAVMLPGHSGGPVINSAGEVVGWNVRHVTLNEATTLPAGHYVTRPGPHVPVACGINEFRPVQSLVLQLHMWCSENEQLRQLVFGVPGAPGGMPGSPAPAVVPPDIPRHFAEQQHCLHVRMHEAQMAAAALAAANDAADQAGDAATAAKAREQAAAAHAKHAEAAAQRAAGAARVAQAARDSAREEGMRGAIIGHASARLNEGLEQVRGAAATLQAQGVAVDWRLSSTATPLIGPVQMGLAEYGPSQNQNMHAAVALCEAAEPAAAASQPVLPPAS